MGEYGIFRINGTDYEGMRMPSGLYHAIVATTETFAKETPAKTKFPFLLSEKYDRFINEYSMEQFRQELDEAGQIILQNPLVQKGHDKDHNETIVLENIFTSSRAAVNIATLIELCDAGIKRGKGLRINFESGTPDLTNLSMERTVLERENNWGYPLDATSVLHDYNIVSR